MSFLDEIKKRGASAPTPPPAGNLLDAIKARGASDSPAPPAGGNFLDAIKARGASEPAPAGGNFLDAIKARGAPAEPPAASDAPVGAEPPAASAAPVFAASAPGPAVPTKTFRVSAHDREALLAAGLDAASIGRYADAFAMFDPHKGRVSEAAVVKFYSRNFPKHGGFSPSDAAAMFRELGDGYGCAPSKGGLDFKGFAAALRQVERNMADLCEASSSLLELAAGPGGAPVDAAGLRALFLSLGESITKEEADDMLAYAASLGGAPPPPRRVTEPAAPGGGFPAAAAPAAPGGGGGAPAAPAPAAPSGAAAKPEFKKYAMMQKMHLPRGAIEQKMRAEGKSDAEVKDFFGE